MTTGSVVLSTVGGSEAGTASAHRALSSLHASVAGIVRAFAARAARACRGRPVVAVQDTSAIGLAAAGGRHGLGPGGDGRHPGFFLHPVAAVGAEDAAVLGLVNAWLWTRGSGRVALDACAPVASREGRALEEKESLRWIAGAAAAGACLEGEAQSLIVVSDQESDLYSHFARRPAGTDLLVRPRHDRVLATGGSLGARAAGWPVLARDTVAPPARPGRPARPARVCLRAGTLVLKRPARGPAHEPPRLALHLRGGLAPPRLALHLVVVDEPEPPEGCEPLCWRLSTTRPVRDAAQARETVRLYRLRWRVEEVFRALKRDGLGLDATQVRGPGKLFRLAALALGAAVRILQLVDARSGGRRPMQDGLDAGSLPLAAALGRAREGSTARLRDPHPPASLAWLAWIVARHGGWTGAGKPPGSKVMARGWTPSAASLAGALIAARDPPP